MCKRRERKRKCVRSETEKEKERECVISETEKEKEFVRRDGERENDRMCKKTEIGCLAKEEKENRVE